MPIFNPYLAGIYYKSEIIGEITWPIDGLKIAGFFKPDMQSINEILHRVYRTGRMQARNMPGEKRIEILQKMADLIEENEDDFIEILVKNTGKTYNSVKEVVEGSIDRLEKANLDLKRVQGDLFRGVG